MISKSNHRISFYKDEFSSHSNFQTDSCLKAIYRFGMLHDQFDICFFKQVLLDGFNFSKKTVEHFADIRGF
jgi:hypothetical protein